MRRLIISRDDFDIERSYEVIEDPDVFNAVKTPGAGFWLGSSPSLVGAPAVRYEETPLVGSSGSRIQYAGHQSREIVLPFLVMVEDSSLLESAVNEFLNFLDPVYANTPLKLEYTNGAGEVRHLYADLIAGTDGLSMEYFTSTSVRMVVVMRAPKPYWIESDLRRIDVTAEFSAEAVLASGSGYPEGYPWGLFNTTRYRAVIDLSDYGVDPTLTIPAITSFRFRGPEHMAVSSRIGGSEDWLAVSVESFQASNGHKVYQEPENIGVHRITFPTFSDSDNPIFAGTSIPFEYLSMFSPLLKIQRKNRIIEINCTEDPDYFEIELQQRHLTC